MPKRSIEPALVVDVVVAELAAGDGSGSDGRGDDVVASALARGDLCGGDKAVQELHRGHRTCRGRCPSLKVEAAVRSPGEVKGVVPAVEIGEAKLALACRAAAAITQPVAARISLVISQGPPRADSLDV